MFANDIYQLLFNLAIKIKIIYILVINLIFEYLSTTYCNWYLVLFKEVT